MGLFWSLSESLCEESPWALAGLQVVEAGQSPLFGRAAYRVWCSGLSGGQRGGDAGGLAEFLFLSASLL